ncbi:MAG TPA: DnaA regulatory inactivator Hda [Usitatibacteraceae bacterium]|nr:DnaA regulatory inactivator Hda [Usitatibacteraceae bacterium]
MRQLLLDFTQAPAPTFENFVPGRNAEPLAALRAALEERGRFPFPERAKSEASPVLYLWGETGSGKTHLLQAFADGRDGARFVRGEDYLGTESGGVLVLDDVERLGEARQVALFNAFNERAFALIVVSAHAAPRDVALRRDLATRLATGFTYRLLPLTDEEKSQALAAHARARGFALSDDVAAYLLTHARRDMPSLIRALDALDRYSLETGRPITVPLLKAALQPELT